MSDVIEGFNQDDIGVTFATAEPRGLRVLVAIDVHPDQATDVNDVVASVYARVCDEAGYLDGGDPITPSAVTVTTVTDTEPLDARTLRGVYEVGVEGAGEWSP